MRGHKGLGHLNRGALFRQRPVLVDLPVLLRAAWSAVFGVKWVGGMGSVGGGGCGEGRLRKSATWTLRMDVDLTGLVWAGLQHSLQVGVGNVEYTISRLLQLTRDGVLIGCGNEYLYAEAARLADSLH